VPFLGPQLANISGSEGLLMGNSKQHVKAIVDGLVAYLRANPAACDGVDGMARWWFNPDDDIDPEVLNMALQYLLHCGVMETLTIGDRTCYRRIGSIADLDAALQSFSHEGDSLC
jgi:hypothetical protein